MAQTIIIENIAELQRAAVIINNWSNIALDTETSPKEVTYHTIKVKELVKEPETESFLEDAPKKRNKYTTSEQTVFNDAENKARGLDPYRNRLRLLQLSNGESTYVIICDNFNPSSDFKVLQPALNNALVIGANLVFDIKQLRHHANLSIKNCWDVSVMELALTAGLVDGNWMQQSSLKNILKKYLDIDVSKEVRETFALAGPITQDQIDYAASDVHYLISIYKLQKELIEQSSMQQMAEIENGALNGVAGMELAGMPVSVEKWRAIAEKAEEERRKMYDDMQRIFLPPSFIEAFEPDKIPYIKIVDCNSTDDLKRALARLGLVLPDTKDQTLTATKVSLTDNYETAQQELPKVQNSISSEHRSSVLRQIAVKTKELKNAIYLGETVLPAIKSILDYRDRQKQATTYGEKWLRFVNPVTGRVHTNIRPYGAETARNSSAQPNLQNIPVRDHPEYRSAFTLDGCPELEDYMLAIADWSGCELRNLAYQSQDPTMLNAFNSIPEQDLHILAAAIIFRRDYNELYAAYLAGESWAKRLRSIAKNINFGIAYGIGPKKVSEKVEIPYRQAKEALEGWQRAFPVASRYLDFLSKQAWDNGVIYGIANHRRFVTKPSGGLTDQEFRRQKGAIEREGRNFPLQNANAVMMKVAQRLVPERIKHLGGEMLLVIHDEIICMAPEPVIDEVGQILLDTMVEVGNSFLCKDDTHEAVRMAAELHIDRYWAK